MSSDEPVGSSILRPWLKKMARAFHEGPENREQLISLLREARLHNLLDTEALSMMEGALYVSEMRVRDITIPLVIDSAHSRFPVIDEDRSEVVGMLLAKDLLSYCRRGSKRFFIRNLLRAAVFVPESKRLNVLLNEFRSNRNHMAIVVDEYGDAAGLVTIEDVLEQIVGEIEDEHDFDDDSAILKRSETEFTIKAHTHIDDFNHYFGVDLDDDEFDTVAGLVSKALGHMPKRGERVKIDRFLFKVLRADSRRVHLLEARLMPKGK